ncbi:MAG: manganese efflux pump MntP family protein [Candidatus Bathyarchaeales archaeon]
MLDPLTLLAVAFGLAMDAFSVSVASGTAVKNNGRNEAFKMAFSFGAFQVFMPLLGWIAGVKLLDFISGVDHWLAFGLLLFVGFKMIYESTKPETHVAKENLSLYTLLILSVATSIDALAIGLSFALLNVSITTPIIVIGTVTFTLSFLGATLGGKIRKISPGKIEILGGIVLILIGFKILLEHLA